MSDGCAELMPSPATRDRAASQYRRALQADDRIRGDAIQRMADSEERPYDSGRNRPGSGRCDRTDAGVHALAQVAHLDAHTSLPTDLLRRRINEELPPDINVLSIEKVRHKFHARHSAVGRSYIYQVSRRRTAFAKPFVWWVKEDLDVELMRAAARQFVGFHDFRAFSDDDPDEKSTEVLIDTLDIHEDEDLIVVHVEGSHFLWKLVRRIVGVLVETGRGGLSVD